MIHQMENQFNDLTEPSIDEEYYCTDGIRSKGFTHLMKLVLVVRKFPEAVEMIKEIITNKPTEVNESNEKGFTALMLSAIYSATFSNIETVQMLINAGADVNAFDKDGTSVLMAVCEYSSNTETVQMLINAGADVNMKDMYEASALIYACRRSDYHDNHLTIKALIDAGADVNIMDIVGYVPLVLVSEYPERYNNIETVRLLINAGADVNTISTAEYGYTALMMACACSDISSCYETVRMLIDAGADVNIVCSLNEYTALMIAIGTASRTSNNETVKMLIDAGADIKFVNPSNGFTALMIACGDTFQPSNIDVIRMLIDAGVNVNVKNKIGDTPLIKFIKSRLNEGKKDTLLLLMRLSTSTICDKNSGNMSAYDYYKQQYNTESLGILNETELEILKGNIAFNNTKSARR